MRVKAGTGLRRGSGSSCTGGSASWSGGRNVHASTQRWDLPWRRHGAEASHVRTWASRCVRRTVGRQAAPRVMAATVRRQPTMTLNQATRTPMRALSAIIRCTNPTSPPCAP